MDSWRQGEAIPSMFRPGSRSTVPFDPAHAYSRYVAGTLNESGPEYVAPDEYVDGRTSEP